MTDAATPPSLKVSEIFDSMQGEGPSAGQACTFLRLAGCNLRCTWCDTPYTWDWARHDRQVEVHTHSVSELRGRLVNAERLVITGGEPLLQQARLATLLAQLPRELPIEVETNGTIAPLPELLERIDQWNVSPKLEHSGESVERAIIDAALSALRDSGRAWLKFVVANSVHADEAMDWVRAWSWPTERVMLMPLAARKDELSALLPVVRLLSAERGVALSPRLHVERWGEQRGV